MHNLTNLAVRLLAPNLAQHPDKTAYLCNNEAVNYQQLADRACRFATLLQQRGIGKGDRVLLVLLDSPVFVAAFLGAILAGAVAVSVSTAMTTEDYRYILDDSGAQIMLVSQTLPVVSELAHAGPHCLVCNESLAGWLDNYQPAPLAAPAVSIDDIAFMTYTSGTTGRPKGVPHRHRDLLVVAEQYSVRVLNITSDDLIFSSVKMFFAYGLVKSLATVLYTGASAVLHSGRPQAADLLQLIERHRPTVFFSVPVVYTQIIRTVATEKLPLSFRLCVSGGEALHPTLFDAWRHLTGLDILNSLGSTEACCFFIANIPGRALAGCSGEAMPGCEIRLVDDDGMLVAPETPGNLQVRVDSAAPFYWNMPEKSAETMLPDGFLRTGDVLFEKNGYYYHLGRSDEMMKVGGKWLSPLQIEEALLAHQAVADCAVASNMIFGLELPAAHIILNSGCEAGQMLEQELRKYLAGQLPKYMQPVRYFFVNELPRTATGKVQRYKLRNHANP